MGVKMEELLNLKASRKWRSAGNAIRFLTKRRRSFRRTADLDAEANNPKLPEQGRASSVVVEAVLHFTESLGEDVPSSEYIGPEAGIEARRFHEPVDDVESTVNGHDVNLTVPASLILENCSCIKICELLGRYEKRALAMFYLVLEAASFLLDLYGKSERALLLAAFLLSAFGFAMCTYTCIMGRSRGSTSVQIQKQLVRTIEIAFSVVQLIVTLVYFILAEIHVKNNFSVSVFPLVFAVIIAVFTFKNDGGASDSSGHEDDDLFGDPPV